MFGDLGNMMKQMGQLKKQMSEMKKITAEASSKDQEVTVKVNGELVVKEVKIADDVDMKKLPILIRDTVNKALHDVKTKTAGQMNLGNLNMPGL